LKAAPDAVKTSDAIVAEATREGDVVPLFMWETYAATSAKVAALMRDGAASADFVVKVDDDRCVAPKHLHDALAEFSRSRAPGEELYLGTYLFTGTEYTSMEGYDGTTSPFQAGPTYALSAGLGKTPKSVPNNTKSEQHFRDPYIKISILSHTFMKSMTRTH
jgi:hypothetical protein